VDWAALVQNNWLSSVNPKRTEVYFCHQFYLDSTLGDDASPMDDIYSFGLIGLCMLCVILPQVIVQVQKFSDGKDAHPPHFLHQLGFA
jgi:hypothetical protein